MSADPSPPTSSTGGRVPGAPPDLAGLPPPSLLERAVALVGDDWRSVAGGLAALVVVAGLAWVLLRPDPPRVEDVLPVATPVTPAPVRSTTTAAAPAGPVLAHAAGAVAVPGLYQVPPGGRVADLLAAAGGPAADADLDRLNLAEVVVDGARVYVPRRDEPVVPPVVPATPSGPATTPAGGPPDGGAAGSPVDLNTATAEQLETLPGVGPATARAILEHRAANGPFAAVDDLLAVRGIGEAKLAGLRDLVTVGP